MGTDVSCRIEGHLATVVLDRPQKHNGLTLEMLADLARVARELARERELRAVILRGADGSFSSGLDLAAAAKSPLAVARTFVPWPGRGTNGFQEACWAWRRLPVPVIAVVEGHCFGGALQLALAADFRFATPDARFSVMESKWGLVPDMSGTVSLAQLVGIDVAKRLAITAEVFDGRRAAELGVVSGVADDPQAEAEALVDQIVARSPDAVAATKLLFERTWPGRPRRAFAIERRLQLALLLGRNAAIARKAGFDRLIPEFEPRRLG